MDDIMDIKAVLEQAFAAQKAGDKEKAQEYYLSIINTNPRYLDAVHYYGLLLCQQNDLAAGEALLQTSLFLNPNSLNYYTNYVQILWHLNKNTEALGLLKKAEKIFLNNPELLGFLVKAYNIAGETFTAKSYEAVLYYLQYRFEESLALTEQLLQEQPHRAELHYNLGCCYTELGENIKAIQAYQQSLALGINRAEAHWNYSLSLLRNGDFQNGWPEYEYRWKRAAVSQAKINFSQPQWTGQALPSDKILLITAEQGLGDAIQFIRYLPLVQEKVKNFKVQCAPELLTLFTKSYPKVQFINRDDTPAAFDYYIPLLSLPRIFNTDFNTIPHHVPYLKTSKTTLLKKNKQPLKVGLAWAGNAQQNRNIHRSMPFSVLAPLLELKNIQFYSLQKGQHAELIPYQDKIIELESELHSLDDTANYMNQMDLIISVDTAIAHLAGALGRPLWVMLAYVSDWRWFLEREDSPWYPTARLFRQSRRSDWTTVITAIQDALSQHP